MLFHTKIVEIDIYEKILVLQISHSLKGLQSKKTPCSRHWWNCIPSLRLKTLKTIPFPAAHTRIGRIRSAPRENKVSQWTLFDEIASQDVTFGTSFFKFTISIRFMHSKTQWLDWFANGYYETSETRLHRPVLEFVWGYGVPFEFKGPCPVTYF